MTQSSITQKGSSRRGGWCFIAAGLAVFLAAGCVAPGPRGELPMGCWSGEGSFVYETWPDTAATQPSEASAKPQSLCREYKTTLCIRPARLDGRDVVEMDIRSARGPFPGEKDMGDETHIKAALVKAKRVSESTVLYRLIALEYNPGPSKKLKVDEKAPPFAASCLTHDGRTVFQIQYMKNFVDSFRFEGPRVEKTGAYFDPDGGMIHWVETLHRSDAAGQASCCPDSPSTALPAKP
jgi:hypothetical protein